MAKKYSKLEIDVSKIYGWIQLWCEEELEGRFFISNEEDKHRIKYRINNEGNEIKIDFQKCAGGLLTICPNVGKNPDISHEIAESIYCRVSDPLSNSPFANGFSLIMSENDFNTLIELIDELDDVTLLGTSVQNEEGKAHYILYRFSGVARDSVVLRYFYNTSRLQIQGKPLYLFNEIVAMASENGIPKDDVVDAHLKYCNINVKKEEIYEEVKEILGAELYGFLNNAHKAILSTSIILSKVDGYIGDYSILVQPANRVFEGFVKKIYMQKGLECEGEDQLGKFFSWNSGVIPVTL